MQNEKNEILKKTGESGIKILLVEDDSFLRDICEKKLKKEGFSVATAVDGMQAVKMAAEFKPALILLDIILPIMDGFEVLKQIRSHNDGAVKKIPVIMLTNLGQEEDSKKALALGANDYLIKAYFTTEDIIQKIRKKLNLK